jgi:hypothetical protein
MVIDESQQVVDVVDVTMVVDVVEVQMVGHQRLLMGPNRLSMLLMLSMLPMLPRSKWLVINGC